MNKLVRFRADPSKVRVSVRPYNGEWLIRVEKRQDPRTNVETVTSDPESGLMHILKLASEGMSGIDLGMGGAYQHPMKG